MRLQVAARVVVVYVQSYDNKTVVVRAMLRGSFASVLLYLSAVYSELHRLGFKFCLVTIFHLPSKDYFWTTLYLRSF